ncbi:MAG: thermosome subunit beta [Candidatus Bathyarchaeia archaeon]|jgi:thermosome
MSAQLGGTPVLILKEGSERSQGKDAQRTNIMAAKVIAEAVRTSLGPLGMDKMLVDSFGDVVITNDGATILKEIDVQHPAAKMMVNVAKTQDEEVGDGTTTAVVLAGELLKNAETLLDQEIHPTVVIEGYRKATEKALEVIDDISTKTSIDDEEMLKRVAVVSMSSKVVAGSREYLSDIAMKAVKMVAEKVGDKWTADIENVKVDKKEGESLENTILVNGIILDKEIVHPGMPKRVENAKIALIAAPLEIEKTEFDAKINITNPEQMKAFLDQEERMLKNMTEKIINVGANVVLLQKGIDDISQHYLAKAGILAVRRIKKSDMEKLARATGAEIITNIEDLTEEDLGEAEVVYGKKIGDDDMVFIEGCKNPKSVSILVRGGTELIVDEAERALHDALCVVRDVIEDGKVVPGGGATEMEVSKRIKEYADTLSGREQLAVKQFAEALEVVPRTLAENAGLDQLDILVELRAKHVKPKDYVYGVDVFTGKIQDMTKMNVWEPAAVKRQVIKSASEAAQMILKIDDVIAASTKGGGGGPSTPPGGGEEGEGGED